MEKEGKYQFLLKKAPYAEVWTAQLYKLIEPLLSPYSQKISFPMMHHIYFLFLFLDQMKGSRVINSIANSFDDPVSLTLINFWT